MLQGTHPFHPAPATNGKVGNVNGGVDSKTPPSSASSQHTLRQVCLELQDKVEAFLAEDVETKLLKGVQAQVKEAVGVIDEALERYTYAY